MAGEHELSGYSRRGRNLALQCHHPFVPHQGTIEIYVEQVKLWIMTQQNLDFEELKEQFSLLNEKLEKQRIINEEMIQESMKEKLSYIEKWYRNMIQMNIVAIPILSIGLIVLFMDRGFGYWGLSLLTLTLGLLDFLLDKKAYNILDIKNLPNLNMIQATEKVIKYKQFRTLANKILIFPGIVLVIWTILIACRYTWNLPIIALSIFVMGVSISWGLSEMKKNQKRLESVLEQIKKLRE